MSTEHYDNFGAKASMDLTNTEKAGRYAFQQEAEKRIIGDVVRKLDLQPADTLLEIGCGPGVLLIPLSHMVNRAAGVDHPEVLQVLEDRAPHAAIDYYPGDFLTLRFPPELRFSKILIYSVLQCLRDEDQVFQFIDKAVGLLGPGGTMLIGDSPNADRKERFLRSKVGRKITEEWDKLTADPDAMGRHLEADRALPLVGTAVRISDALMAKILVRYRAQGLETYLLPQPHDLPFGYTREDIVLTTPGD